MHRLHGKRVSRRAKWASFAAISFKHRKFIHDEISRLKGAQEPRVHLWSRTLSAWAQIITVFVLIFGYFYTVRPTFQKERLEERVAQLQIQENSLNQRLVVAQDTLTQAKEKRLQEQTELKKYVAALGDTKNQLNGLKNKLNIERQRLKALKIRNMKVAQVLDRSEAAYFYFLFEEQLLPGNTGPVSSLNPSISVSVLKRPKKMARLKKYWKSAYDVLMGAESRASERATDAGVANNSVQHSIRSFIEGHKKELACPIPNLSKMAIRYKDDIAEADADARQKLPIYLEKVKKQSNPDNNPHVVVQLSKRFKGENLRILEMDSELAVNEKFEKELMVPISKCSEKVTTFDRKIRALLGVQSPK